MKERCFVVLAASVLTGSTFAWAPANTPGAASEKPMLTEWGAKVTPENAWREYPRPQMERASWTCLNGLWQYAITATAASLDSMPSRWEGEILVPFPVESSLSGVGRLLEPNELLWYRRVFSADVGKDERLILNFEKSDWRTMVFVNGVEAGIPHEGGETAFSFDITGLVKSGENELVVSVWDPTSDFVGSHSKQNLKPAGCMYTRCSGICGTVWLEKTPSSYIRDYRVQPDPDSATARFIFELEGPGSGSAMVDIDVDGVGQFRGRAGDWIAVSMPKDFKWWSPEEPNLYRFTARYGKDAVSGWFGMRKFEKRKDDNGVLRFYLNNRPRFIIGTLDQGWWPDGLLVPPSEEAMAFDIKFLKSAGFDMMRKHLKVEPRRYYALCDKLGLIVLQDMPMGSADVNKRYGFYRREWKEIIDELYNVPSIVMWIPYNEGWGQPGPMFTRATLLWTRRYDPSRLVDGPSGANDWEGGEVWQRPRFRTEHLPMAREEAGDAVDLHDYNALPSMFPVNDRRVSFLGEFGGIGCRVEGHLWSDKVWGYRGSHNAVDRKVQQDKFIAMMEHVAGLARLGLGGSVYTQTTDVEIENNGLLTYDRRVAKFDVAAMTAVHAKVRKSAEAGTVPHEEKVVFNAQDDDPSAWAYTTDDPGNEWVAAEFDDSSWKRSASGFGDKGTEAAYKVKVSTVWKTNTLWLRRHFTIDDDPSRILAATFKMFHDENAYVFINGKILLKVSGYNKTFEPFCIPGETLSGVIKKGDNVMAVQVRQTTYGQYFDTGLSITVAK